MEDQNTQKNKMFPDGLNFKRPSPNVPEFVKGKLGLNVKRLLVWLNENKLEAEWLNFDLLKSREGNLYFKLNTYNPPVKVEAPVQKPESQRTTSDGRPIPFPNDEPDFNNF